MASALYHALITELHFFLEPVVAAAGSPRRRRQLFESLGWQLEAIPGLSIEHLDTAISATVDAYQTLVDLAGPETTTDLETAKAVLETVDKIWTAIETIQRVSDRLDVPDLDGLRHVGQELINVLAVEYLRRHHPTAYEAAILLTLVRLREVADPVSFGTPPVLVRRAHVRPELRLDRIVPLLRDPVGTLRKEHVGEHGLQTVADAQRAADSIFPHLGGLLATLGVPVYYGLDPTSEDAPDFGPVGNELAPGVLAIFLPPHEVAGGIEAGGQLMLALSPAERGDLGLVVVPVLQLLYANRFDDWTLAVQFDQQVAAFAVGPRGLTLLAGADVENVSGALTLSRVRTETGDELPAPDEEPEAPLTIGGAGSTRLELNRAEVTISCSLDKERQDFGFLAATDGAFVVSPGDGDGFLQKVLPAGGLRTEFDLALGWSRARGLHIGGGAGLEATIPVRKSLLGVVDVDSVHVAITPREAAQDAAPALDFLVAASGSLRLGPLTATIDRVGLGTTVAFPERGNLGPLALMPPKFKPPDGAGLALDAGIVVGGGYLFFDPDKAEYAGVLQLEFQETLTITAIGLLTTRLPDGRSGFSLVVLITAQGFTPIQLGFGFTLNGVGGLLGVHRTVVIDVLRAGVKTGTLDAVLFPTDPIRHAPQILSALRAVFPPAEGRYVFGPMAILGWGTPTILTAELTVLLTLPAPIRLIVLGQFRVLLPSAEDVALVRLQMDALGVIDFDRREAAIDATLYDSRLLQYVLSGDMALRARWGATPTLVVAVGGFHPRFTPPPGFPALERIAVSLTTGDTPRLRLDAYLAVTANTVQIGARLDLYAREGGFSIQGQLGFDALFTLAPFQFVADVGGRVALKRGGRKLGGVRLDLTVTGPRQLQARGHATFEILSVRHRVRLRATFGHDDPAPPRPAVDIAALVAGALAERRNWSAQTPADGPPLVTLRALDPGAAVLAHPASAVTVRQRLVPLDVEVARFGGVAPAGARRVAIARVALAGQTVAATPVREAFAPGQFLDLTDEEKLAAPAFERYTAGATVAGDALATGARSEADFGYETIYVTPPAAAPPAAPTPYVVPDTRLPGLTRWGAAGRSPLRATGARKYRAPARAVAVADAAFAVVDEATLTPAGTAAAPATRLTYLEAVAVRRSYAAAAATRATRHAIVSATTVMT